jgi:RNA polymerase sigma factor (sigma-70 family)
MPETPLDQLLAQRKHFLAFVQRRVSDSGLAEDILQTAYLRAFEHRDDFKPSESVVAWSYRLLRNAVIDSYRRRHASKERALEAWTRELEISAQPSPEIQNEVCACLHGIAKVQRSHNSFPPMTPRSEQANSRGRANRLHSYLTLGISQKWCVSTPGTCPTCRLMRWILPMARRWRSNPNGEVTLKSGFAIATARVAPNSLQWDSIRQNQFAARRNYLVVQDPIG